MRILQLFWKQLKAIYILEVLQFLTPLLISDIFVAL